MTMIRLSSLASRRSVWALVLLAACVALACVWARVRSGPSRPPSPSAASVPPPKGSAPEVSPPGRQVSPRGAFDARPASRAPSRPAVRDTSIQLRDVSAETGIAFQHTDGSSGRYHIFEAMCGGLATLDYDGDGLVDVYFVNGAEIPGVKFDKPPTNQLYKNLGGVRFRDATAESGAGDTGYGMGATAGDYDNDGHTDIFVSNFGPKALYRNSGRGTFVDVARQSGVTGGDKVGAGVCFLDADEDGDLDLLVANYVKFSFETHVMYVFRGRPSYPSPVGLEPEPLTLYRNLGDGSFQDSSAESGVGRCAGRGMGTICADYNADGRTDMFIANDLQENFLLRNAGDGKFEEVALAAGTAYDAMGRPRANMGVDCADFDNDGRLDFYVTAYEGQTGALYRQIDSGFFQDVSDVTGAGQRTAMQVTWGCGLVDFDNDGHRDVFVACGHTEDNIQQRDNAATYAARPILLRNTGDGQFVDVSDSSGDGLNVKLVGRGAAFEDLDNDGDLDVVVVGLRGKPAILRNMLYESGARSHWLQVRLQGVKTNRDGVGARVKVVVGDSTQIDEVHSGRSYQSHWGSRLHFGLGARERVDRVEVHWVGGGVDVLENVPADQRIVVLEGRHTGLEARTP